jgi:hypothetical protein
MNRHFWSRLLKNWLSGSRRTKQNVSNRPRFRPNLEHLEPRVVPTQTMTPPSFFQAAVSLYRDGVELAFIQRFTVNFTDGGGSSGSLTIFGLSAAQVQADIGFNTPYAQPFSTLLVMSGETAESNLITAFENSPEQHAANVQANSFL